MLSKLISEGVSGNMNMNMNYEHEQNQESVCYQLQNKCNKSIQKGLARLVGNLVRRMSVLEDSSGSES